MSEYIEREAVNALIKAECSPKVAAYLIDAVATIPAADVRPNVTGRWIDHQMGRWVYAKCSECETVHDVRSNFCPNCGADMRPEPPKEET